MANTPPGGLSARSAGGSSRALSGCSDSVPGWLTMQSKAADVGMRSPGIGQEPGHPQENLDTRDQLLLWLISERMGEEWAIRRATVAVA